MQLKTIAKSNMRPYITLVDVELPHDGQHAKREHAAWPQQHASLKMWTNNVLWCLSTLGTMHNWMCHVNNNTHLTNCAQRK